MLHCTSLASRFCFLARRSVAGAICPGLVGLGFALLPVQDGMAAEKHRKPAAKPEVRPAARPEGKPEVGRADSFQHGAQISLMDAVRETLSRSPRIQIEQTRTEVSRGTVMARSGAFDTRLFGNGSHGSQRQEVLQPNVAQGTPTQIFPVTDLTTGDAVPGVGIVIPGQPAPPPGPSVSLQNSSDFDVGLHRRLRNGAEVATQGVYSRRNQEATGPTFNISELRLTVQVPLLRVFTLSEEASLERSARIDYAASLLAKRHVISEAIAQTARAYWSLRAAQERLDLLRISEDTAISLRKLVEILIVGEERARVDIYQVDARVFETTARRLGAEQSVFEARQQLGLAMGLDGAGLRSAPMAGEPFPPTDGLARIMVKRDRLIADALLLRADYQAARKSEQSAGALLNAARHNLLPRMDFQLRTSYFGGELGSRFENLWGSFHGNQTGVSVVGQLSFDWPFGNRDARGRYLTSGAQHEQAVIQANDIRRNIVSGVIVSVNALANGSAQLLQADEAVRAYREAIETERLKYKAGSATLLDVINTEDRWIEALIAAVAARQQIAEGYARLRFESGTMLPGEGTKLTLGNDVLVTVPVAVGEIPFARIPSFRTRTQLR